MAKNTKNVKVSIVTRLSLLFLTLAVVNLIVTWVFSGANQMRLISEKANLSGSSVAFEILRRVAPEGPALQKAMKVGKGLGRPELERMASNLMLGGNEKKMFVPGFELVTSEFEALGSYPAGQAKALSAAVTQNILKALQLRDLSGQPYLAVPDIMEYTVDLYIPLTNTLSRDLIFITRVQMDSIPEDLKSLVRLIFATIAIMLAIQVAIGFLIYRILIKPIRDVSTAAVALGGGTFSQVAIPKRERDEILLLIESFNQMSEDLRRKDETIRNQVDELQEKNDTMDFELEIAERIQQSIMPDAEKIESFKAALEYVPLYKVSGDYYDFVRLPDSSVAVMIADASGHGVPAAFLTILMKVYFTDLVHKHDDPAELMRAINHSISRYLESTGFYLTAFFIRIYPSLEAEYCNCGHPPQIRLSAAGKIDELGGECDVIGLSADSDNFIGGKFKLDAGDKIILFTDGLTELKNDNREFLPEADFHALLSEYAGEPADKLRERVLAFARNFQGGHKASDDLTLVVLPVAELIHAEAPAAPGVALSVNGGNESRDAKVAHLLQEIIRVNDAPSYHALLANAYLRLGKTELARETLVSALGRFSDSAVLQKISEKMRIRD